ncbi:hypothetical protein [uncultured Psychrobacter sp.]|uniref:hypothetical protein n=1 Tax=uncultured Psychrobacter sp. TaxID=259303 RepID=UPI00345A564C
MINKLPEEYVPFNKVWVCSNTFNNGNVILEVDSKPVFLIGRDKEIHKTLLWFNSPEKGSNISNWINVISKNKVNDMKFDLTITEYGNEVSFDRKPLLQYKIIDSNLVINMIDLTPIGLNVYGGLSSLTIASNNITNSMFTHVNTMIAIGK